MILTKEKKIFHIVVILLILGNLNIIPLFYKVLNGAFSPKNFQQNEAVEFVNKISTANQYIPNGTRVGFLTDIEPKKIFIDPKAVKKFFLTQYAIAPRILDTNLETPYIIGAFEKPPSKKTYLSKKYDVFKVISKDIIIFKRKNDV